MRVHNVNIEQEHAIDQAHETQDRKVVVVEEPVVEQTARRLDLSFELSEHNQA